MHFASFKTVTRLSTLHDSVCVDRDQSRLEKLGLLFISVISVNFQMVSVLQAIHVQHKISCNLQSLGCVYKESDMIRSIWDWTHYGTGSLCLHETGSKLERYGSLWDQLHKWTHLVPDSRSDPYWTHQVPCECKAYPYQFRTGSKQIRPRVNTALI